MRIVTLTLNPALDLETSVERIEPERKMRCTAPRIEPGGGGINVARVVAELGGEPLAVVALGGPVGEMVASEVEARGIPLERVETAGVTRQSFTAIERASERQYRFVLPGPPMAEEEWERCRRAVLGAAEGASHVVASSSMPAGIPDDVLARLATDLAPTGARLVVDTSGPALARALAAPVELVKPSANELRGIAGQELNTTADYVATCRELLSTGQAGAIVVSLGAGGAVLVPRDEQAHVLHPPAVRVVSTIGAGDSMVAAMTVALARGDSLLDAARLGVAAGTAAVVTPGTALCRRQDVEAILPQVTVAPFAG